MCLAVPMYAQTTLDVDGIGTFHLHPTQYGDFIEVDDTLSGELAFITDASGNLSIACEPISQDLTDKIAVLLYDSREGGCNSADKVSNAIDAGAKAVIIVKTVFPSNFQDPNDISDIPVFVVMLDEFSPVLENMNSAKDVQIYYFYDHSEEVIWSEDFGNGFASSNGQWTSVGVTSDTALWKYEPDAQSNGDIRNFLIDSPTKGNGAALMDNGRYLANGEIPDTYPYGDIGGQLISPVIDLSTSGPVSIKWWQFCVGLNSVADTYIGFYYSLDGGTTWMPRINLTTENIFNANTTEIHNPEIRRVFIPDAAGTAEFRFKIEFRSDYYAMLVDDIQVVAAPETDLAVDGAPFYTPQNYAQPTYVIQYDTFYFSVPVTNQGAVAQDNIGIRADIIDLATGETVGTVEGISDAVIPVGETSDVEISETYVPENLPIGSYKIRYTVLPDDADNFPENNKAEIYFKVTENSMAMSNMVQNGWATAGDNGTFGVGNIYALPVELQDDYKVGSVDVSYITTDDNVDVSDKSLTILITAVPDSIKPDYSNIVLNASQDPFNNENLIQVAFQDVSLAGSSEGDIITAAGDSFTDASSITDMRAVPLEKGTRYIVWNLLQDSTLGIALNFDHLIVRPPSPFIYGRDGNGTPRYYWYYTRGAQAVIQLNLQLATTVDKSPLPAEAFTIYPNPVATSTLYAELNFTTATDATVTIADMSGMVHSIQNYDNVLQQTISRDVSDLPAGTYLIRLATQNGTRTVKFIKQ